MHVSVNMKSHECVH